MGKLKMHSPDGMHANIARIVERSAARPRSTRDMNQGNPDSA